MADRKAIFEAYVRSLAEDHRNEKLEKVKVTAKEYQKLLEQEVKSPKTSFESFKKKFKDHSAYKAVDVRDREKLFNERISSIKLTEEQLIRNAYLKAKTDFEQLLAEKIDVIQPKSQWIKIKEIIDVDDLRYEALSSREHEDIFKAYTEQLLTKTREDGEIAKKGRRAREVLFSQDLINERAKALTFFKEATQKYKSLIAEKITDWRDALPWAEFKKKCKQEPRFTSPFLTPTDREEIFGRFFRFAKSEEERKIREEKERREREEKR